MPLVRCSAASLPLSCLEKQFTPSKHKSVIKLLSLPFMHFLPCFVLGLTVVKTLGPKCVCAHVCT